MRFTATPWARTRAPNSSIGSRASWLGLSDAELECQVPILGRRVDYLHRRYVRDWQELFGVVLYGQSHFTVDPEEWQVLQALDGRQPLRDILEQVAPSARHEHLLAGVRQLAQRGVVDLLPGKPSRTFENGHHVEVASQSAG